MTSESVPAQAIAVRLQGIGKQYFLASSPRERLLHVLTRKRPPVEKLFVALEDISFELRRGEVMGIIGRNGAGKSTLLQIIAGVLQPNIGTVEVNGRVASLLELGAGFNPEFTGRENILMSASLMGLSQKEINGRYQEIIDFAGIGSFIHQPVKTYSSGMYVRLAFSTAITLDPDILIIDEALSVGDGVFARKSFDRIMSLKDQGKTIIFCSHSMYHVDAICNRALWLEHGKAKMIGQAKTITTAYNADLIKGNIDKKIEDTNKAKTTPHEETAEEGRILGVIAEYDGHRGKSIEAISRSGQLLIQVEFFLTNMSSPPSIALSIENGSGICVSSILSIHDNVELDLDDKGCGRVTVVYPEIPLLKGRYFVNVFLACDRGLHVFDHALNAIEINVCQSDLLQGIVALPHKWIQQ
jgi:lipopolysaccharide transport system ATP-binding protein